MLQCWLSLGPLCPHLFLEWCFYVLVKHQTDFIVLGSHLLIGWKGCTSQQKLKQQFENQCQGWYSRLAESFLTHSQEEFTLLIIQNVITVPNDAKLVVSLLDTNVLLLLVYSHHSHVSKLTSVYDLPHRKGQSEEEHLCAYATTWDQSGILHCLVSILWQVPMCLVDLLTEPKTGA